MQNKKLIILIILSVFAIFSLMRGLVISPKSRRRVSSETSSVLQAENVRLAGEGSLIKRQVKRSSYGSWGRNPFTLKASTGSSQPLRLNGIAWDKNNSQAIINNRIMGIGDKINDVTVIDIKKDKVILNDGKKDFELRL